MDTKVYTPKFGAALHLRRTEIQRLIYTLWNVLRSGSRIAFRRMRDAIGSTFREMSEDRRNRLVFAELSRMSDYELYDIGLSRSDLTLEGLAIAGAKRALKQDAIAKEVASSSARREALDRED